jgi:phage/plasmid-associated DNA primase
MYHIRKHLDCELFDNNLITSLDANPNLIGFNNGVYNTVTREFLLGHPDDHISLSTNINYIALSDTNKDTIGRLNKILEEIITDRVTLDELITDMILYFFHCKLIHIYQFKGTGCNGRSFIEQLFKYMLGDYYYKRIEQTTASLLLVQDTRTLDTVDS